MDRKIIIGRLIWLLLIPFGVTLSNMGSARPDAVEALYSESFYKVLSQYYSRIFGIAPFSVAELLLYLLMIVFLVGIVRIMMLLIKTGKNGLTYVGKSIAKVIMFVSIAYMFFITVWGMNYYRQPFAELAGYDKKAVNGTELAEVCKVLIRNANELRSKVAEDGTGVMKLDTAPPDELKKVSTCYKNASLHYSELAGKYAAPKPVLYSTGMSYLGISGIYSPFTAEANVNMDIPSSMLPSTACHEAAHLRGFAREDEANFIAYLACSYSNDPDFKYSGTLLAVMYSMNALRSVEPDIYAQLRQEYSEGVVRDMKAINKYWDKFSGPVERTQNKVNNAYLKANKQAQGVASYGRMVDLLIMKYRKEGLNP